MDIQQFYEFSLAKKGVTEHFPFDQDTLVLKVGGKMFVLTSLSDWEKGCPSLNLKCDPDYALELRASYDAILPGYHMSKKHWNTVQINGTLTNAMICQLISDSYTLVFESLPKKIKNEIQEL
jgi:predicted DNA-binding protein (MmcQ/YjbR family)